MANERDRKSAALIVMAWVVIVGVAVIVVARGVQPIHPLMLALTGLLPFALIPVSAAIIVGGLTWRPPILATGALVAVATLGVTASSVPSGPCVQFDEAADDSIVVYQANVLWAEDGGDPQRYLDDLSLADPDLIALQEASSEFVEVFEADERLAAYPFRVGPGRTRLYSRFPIVEDRSAAGDAVGFYISALVESPAGEIEVTVVHTSAPIQFASMQRWEEHFDRIDRSVVETERRIIVGDFNATSNHRPFRDLMDAGLLDAHDQVGCGLGSTWPIAHVAPFPFAVMRLDHVLHTESFEAVSMRTGRAIPEPLGSDHHPLVVELRPK